MDEEGKAAGRSKESNLRPPTLAMIHWKLTRMRRAPKPQSKPPIGAATKAPVPESVKKFNAIWVEISEYQRHSNRWHTVHLLAATILLRPSHCQNK